MRTMKEANAKVRMLKEIVEESNKMIHLLDSAIMAQVKINVINYLDKNNLGKLVDIMPASEHPDDYYLYHVIAKKPNTNKVFHDGEWNYSCWTCYNASTNSLNYGHYNLSSEKEARKICNEMFHRIY